MNRGKDREYPLLGIKNPKLGNTSASTWWLGQAILLTRGDRKSVV